MQYNPQKNDTMINTGYIHISEHSVSIFPFNGEVWLTTAQIADLFGVFTGAVRANIKSIFKNGILYESEAYRTHSTSDSIIDLYNLKMVIALSYRLTSRKAAIFKEWVYDNIAFPVMIPEISFRVGIPN